MEECLGTDSASGIWEHRWRLTGETKLQFTKRSTTAASATCVFHWLLLPMWAGPSSLWSFIKSVFSAGGKSSAVEKTLFDVMKSDFVRKFPATLTFFAENVYLKMSSYFKKLYFIYFFPFLSFFNLVRRLKM